LSLRDGLRKLDFDQEKIRSFYCPIGLGFGDSTPIEISHSVVAQLLQTRDQHNGQPRDSIDVNNKSTVEPE
jgi:xanthine/CO dehydrogenase XdhC/CoxF family maturation factor